jgi:Tfp pilus assembly major pilin PilA
VEPNNSSSQVTSPMDGVVIEESSPDLSPTVPLPEQENNDISRQDKAPSLRIPLENAFTMDCDCILDSIATDEAIHNIDDYRIEVNESPFMNGGCFGFAYKELLVSKETNNIVNPILFTKDLSSKEANSIIWLENIEKTSITDNDLELKEKPMNQLYEDLISEKTIYFLLNPSNSPQHEDQTLFNVHAIKLESTDEENGQSIPFCTFDEDSMKIMDILPYHQQTSDEPFTESTNAGASSWNAMNKLEEQKRSLLSSSSPSGPEKEFSSVSFQTDYSKKPFLFLLWKPDADNSENTSSEELERKLQILSSIPMESHRNNDDENEQGEERNSFLFSLQFNSSLLDSSSFCDFRTHPVFNRETIRNPLEIRFRELIDDDEENRQQQLSEQEHEQEETQESISSTSYLQSWKLFFVLILLISSLKLFPQLQEVFIVSHPPLDPSEYSLQTKNLLVSTSDQPLVLAVHLHQEERQQVYNLQFPIPDLIGENEDPFTVSSQLSVLIVEETEVKENEDEETELISAITTTAVILTEVESSLPIDNECPLPKFLIYGEQSEEKEGEIVYNGSIASEPNRRNEHKSQDQDSMNQESNNETMTTVVVEAENSTSEQSYGTEHLTINNHQASSTQNSIETTNNSDNLLAEKENHPTPQKVENNKTIPEKDGSINILSILVKLFKFSLIYGLLFFFLFVLLNAGLF